MTKSNSSTATPEKTPLLNSNREKPDKATFVKEVHEAAKIEEQKTGVPAAVTTAQAILETGYGKSVPTDVNSGKYSHNLFGIKAHGNPNYVEVWTHENLNGKRVKILDKFASYDSFEDSIAGRTEFLTKTKDIMIHLRAQTLKNGLKGCRIKATLRILTTLRNLLA